MSETPDRAVVDEDAAPAPETWPEAPEVPEADAAEQLTGVRAVGSDGDASWEATEADTAEQRVDVPLDEEDYR